MQQGTTNVFELKGQARRLRDALAELNSPVSHTVALNLIAKVHGSRNWETLEAAATEEINRQLVEAKKASQTQEELDSRWLAWVEAVCRLEGCTESDFDELLYGALGDDDASEVNNSGMSAQLKALFDWHAPYGTPRQHLLEQLEGTSTNLTFPIPEGKKECVREEPYVRIRISVCAGSAWEQYHVVDCLEWFAAHTPADVDALVADGLHNSELSDQVALWLAQHSQDKEVRSQLTRLLEYMRSVHAGDNRQMQDSVGVTAYIDEDDTREYVQRTEEWGVNYAPKTFELLED